MWRGQGVDYAASADHVPEARHWLQGRLLRWELNALLADASLLITEIVTNAVVHASSAFDIVGTVADGVLEVGVSDHDPRHPQSGPSAVAVDLDRLTIGAEELASPLAERGRGIAMVDLVADDFGCSGGVVITAGLMAARCKCCALGQLLPDGGAAGVGSSSAAVATNTMCACLCQGDNRRSATRRESVSQVLGG